MQKLPASTFKLALIHTLRGGVFIPIISSLIVIPLLLLFKVSDALIMSTVVATISTISTWFGANYSAKQLSNKYVLTKVPPLLITSTILLIVLRGVGTIDAIKNNEFALITALSAIVSIVLFYLASNKILSSLANDSVDSIVISDTTQTEFPNKKALTLTFISTITSTIFIIFGAIALLASAFGSGAPGGLKILESAALIMALLTAAFSLYSLTNIWTQYKLQNYKSLLKFIYVPYYFALPLFILILIINVFT